MKVVILAGGFGTRLSEETILKPKPMVEIGDKPILWHIMKVYAYYGFNEFIICLGYKGYCIKEWFNNYRIHNDDLTFDLKNNSVLFHNKYWDDWKVTLVDTGAATMTGGRLKRIQSYVGTETFMATYGDGISDLNIKDLVRFHKKQGKAATLTAVLPEGRFGALQINQQNSIIAFSEKNDNTNWVNGGFFVFESEVFDYIKDDNSVLEKITLESLAKAGQLCAFKHHGFWKPMDKLLDKKELNEMWNTAKAPWKLWGGE